MLRVYFSGVLIILCILVSADLYQMYLFDFEDFWWTSFSVDEKTDTDEMISDVYGTAKKYGLELFYVKKEISGWHTSISIYCEDSAKEILEAKYKLQEGYSKSLFSGDSVIRYSSWSDLDGSEILADYGEYYLIGCDGNSPPEEQVFGYKRDLFEEYGGDLKSFEGNKLSDCKEKLTWLWAVILLIICALTYYRVLWVRKSLVIRISLGESARTIVLFEYLRDSIVYILTYIIGIAWLKSEYGVICFDGLMNQFITYILLGALLIYLTLLTVDIRRGLSHVMLNEKILVTSFVIKSIMIVLFSISLSTSFALIYDYNRLIKQRPFYEKNNGYSHLILYGEDIDTINILYKEFIRQNYTLCNIQYIGDLYQYGNGKGEVAIYANSNMSEYLCGMLLSETEQIKSSESCLLIPYRMKLSEDEYDELYGDAISYVRSANTLPVVIRYTEDVDIVSIGNSGEHLLKNNPIIIYCNIPDSERSYQEYIPSYNYQHAILMIDERDLIDFCDVNGCKYRLVDVYDNYMENVNSIKHGILVNGFFLLFQIASEIVFSVTLIQLDFKTNGMEKVLKKLFGYTLFGRMGLIPKIIIVTGFASNIFSVVLYRFLGLTGLAGAVIVSLFFLLMELSIYIVTFLKFENDAMMRSLKYGNI